MPSPRSAGRQPARLRVLVVDDNRDTVDMLALLLELRSSPWTRRHSTTPWPGWLARKRRTV